MCLKYRGKETSILIIIETKHGFCVDNTKTYGHDPPVQIHTGYQWISAKNRNSLFLPIKTSAGQ